MNDNHIDFDRDGFIKNPDNWSIAVAEKIAEWEGIAPMSEDHWKVITTLRKLYFINHQLPVMRHICREAGLDTQGVSNLLADPKVAWRIAGLPNPGEEAKVYMETAELHD